MNAGLVPEDIEVETVRGSSPPVLYNQDIVEVLRKQVLLAYNDDVRFHSHEN